MSKIEQLIEQTSFLIQKQREAQEKCSHLFNELLEAVQERLDKVDKANKEEVEPLEEIADLLSEQAEALTEDAQSDIDFLTEQLDALKKIHNEKDEAKKAELLSMLIDENEEIKDTESFKQEVTEEALLSQQNLATMISDIKNALKESSPEELALYLESVLATNDDSDGSEDDNGCCDDDENCCDGDDACCDDEEECNDCTCGLGEDGKCTCKKVSYDYQASSCGGCTGCGEGGGCGSGCGSGDAFDIFTDLAAYEKEFFKDTDKKVKH